MTGAACPSGSSPGQTVDCECGDAGTMGAATCQDDGTLGTCDCSGGAGSGGAGAGATGGSGGMSMTGTGGMTGGMSATGGSGGTGMSGDDDGGEPMEMDSSVPTQPLPDDGNQGSVCTMDRDCNRELGCFNSGFQGQGFCSAICEEDADCEAIAGAAYTCSMTTGVCQVECMGEDDTESCPDQMECISTGGGFPGGGGMMATFRCKYPDAAPDEPMEGTQGAYEECSMEMPCAEGFVCNPSGIGMGGPGGGSVSGYCTIACEVGTDNACGDIEAPSGDLTPECTTAFGGGGPGGGGTGRCTLGCGENPDGCPDGMTCIDYTAYQRCGYE